MRKKAILLTGLLALILAGCQTISADFEEGTQPEVFFQRAQSASDASDYDKALLIYDKFLKTDIKDPIYTISAEYEIAFLRYKKGQVSEALVGFKAILAQYSDPNRSFDLPAWPKVLAVKMLQKLEKSPATAP